MNPRAALLFLLLSPAIPAAWNPYLTDSFAASAPSLWYQNGSLTYGASGLSSTSVTGGSLISRVGAPDGTSSYEVYTTIGLNSTGGTLVHYLRATSDALLGPTTQGTFLAVEFENTSGVPGGCAMSVRVYTRVGGVLTLHQSATTGCWSGMSAQTVISDGGYLHVYVGGFLYISAQIPGVPATGMPGVGVRNAPTSTTIQAANMLPADRIGPAAVAASTISTSTSPNAVDLQWKGVIDDPAGRGVRAYFIWRDGIWLTDLRDETFADTTVSPGQSYTYYIAAADLHGNFSAFTGFTVVTPPAGSKDARRVGVAALGAHWGAGGENIDLRSGNLNFTLPLLTAKGRGNVSFPVSLSYNSQNWRLDQNTISWKLGRDTGFGFGWRVNGGSLTPYFSSYWEIHHFTFRDATGAEYRLNLNADGTYRSQGEGVYLTFTRSDGRLHFNDGTFWEMGVISEGEEEDAGTLYPNKIQDTNGNQILVTYKRGLNAPATNSSSKIRTIEDGRASSGITYDLTYTDIDGRAHLTGITNTIGTAEAYTLYYDSAQTAKSPFSPYGTFGTTALLRRVQNSIGTQWFFYGSNGAGELERTTSPYGAEMSWVHTDFSFANNQKKYREATTRCLKPTAYATQQCWSLTPEATDDTRQMHSKMTLSETGGNGVKVYEFETDMSTAHAGLLKTYQEKTAAAPVATLKQVQYTWATSSVGQPFIQQALTTLNLGTSSQAESKTWQNIDAYGNLVEQRIYDYGALTTPTRTLTYSYLNSSGHVNAYIRNRLTSATVTKDAVTRVLTTRTYDEYVNNPCSTIGPGLGIQAAPTSPAPRLHDASYTTSYTLRGNLGTEIQLGRAKACRQYDELGNVVNGFTYNNLNGPTTAVTWDGARNYAVPATITPNSNTDLQQSASYNAFLGVTQLQLPNQVIMDFGWDAQARPSTTQSPHGAETTHTYAIDPTSATPYIHTETVNGRWTKTTTDGLGRPTRVERGYSTTTVTIQDTEYGPCACSPTGKVKRVSTPYAPGGTPVWTTYAFDACGRTVSILKPGNTNAITYTYAGNKVTVTDERGKWKTQTLDVFGNIKLVTEPVPAPTTQNPWAWSGTRDTAYTYNLMGQMETAAMTRNGTTQTRTWNYDSSQRLQSESLPETGAATYTYDAGGRLSTRTDARGVKTEWIYDIYSRVSEIRRYQPGASQPDPTQGEVYTYSSVGRLSSIRYGFDVNGSGSDTNGVTEYFGYTKAGVLKGRSLSWPSYRIGTLGVGYAYDESTTKEGRPISLRYPSYWDPQTSTTKQGLGLTFEYNEMGQLRRVLDTDTQAEVVRSAAYNAAGQLTQWERLSALPSGTMLTESYDYNSRGQIFEHKMEVLPSNNSYIVRTKYWHDTAGDGTLRQREDLATGETVDYTYNVLGQLTKAETTSTEWGQSFVFDGFGNLTQQAVTKGSAPSMTLNVNPANNRVTGSGISYDAAGNLTNMLYNTIYYDLANRASWVVGAGQYKYTASNERLLVHRTDGTNEVHMRGPGGELIGAYRIDWENGNSLYTLPVRLEQHERVHVAGRLLFVGGSFVATDRLGSVVYKCGSGAAVQNGGFETGVASWTSYGGAQNSAAAVPRTGSLSLRMTVTTANAGVYQDVTGLVPGMTYQFNAWVRSESGWTMAALTASNPDGSNLTSWGTQSISTNWQALSVGFRPNSQGVVRIRLVKMDTADALYWDDVEVPAYQGACTKGTRLRYYPYGQEIGTVTANDTAKFGTYTRDSGSGLDYAMNRYYMSTWGRFTTADPYRASGGPGDPGSWNRYTYTRGDPVNRYDPAGLLDYYPILVARMPGRTVTSTTEFGSTGRDGMDVFMPEMGDGWDGVDSGDGGGGSCPTTYEPEVDLDSFIPFVEMDFFEWNELFGPGNGEQQLHVLPAFAIAAATAARWVVYWGQSPQGQYYIGITSQWVQRHAAHSKNGMQVNMVQLPKMNYAAAKGVEQALIEANRQGAGVINKINSISPTSSYYEQFKAMGLNILKGCSAEIPPGIKMTP